MAQHNANGMALATCLASHPRVQKVYYPGLPTHPQHELAKRQMRGFGGMIAFDTGSIEAVGLGFWGAETSEAQSIYWTFRSGDKQVVNNDRCHEAHRHDSS